MPHHEPWQLEGTAAELYERHLVPAITVLWAADLVERVAPSPKESRVTSEGNRPESQMPAPLV